ncbi:MAG: GerMN domain-containing protein [Candidatus Eremiobacteraeota bacterium]|nr:GerMN domain-containing protein [Candidatus Eremiobacteraeota bacterium]
MAVAAALAAASLGGCSRHPRLIAPQQITVYYCKAGSDALVRTPYTVDAKLRGLALANYAVDQLLAGPTSGQNAFVLFPPGTAISLSSAGDKVVANIEGPLARAAPGGASDEVALFKSLTWTLTDLAGIKSVQVTVHGRKSATLPGGEFDLEEPLTRGTFAQ